MNGAGVCPDVDAHVAQPSVVLVVDVGVKVTRDELIVLPYGALGYKSAWYAPDPRTTMRGGRWQRDAAVQFVARLKCVRLKAHWRRAGEGDRVPESERERTAVGDMVPRL